jgi:hypothetical protein
LFCTFTVCVAGGDPPVVVSVYECDGPSQSNGAAVAPVAAPGVAGPPSTLRVVPDAFWVLQFSCTVSLGQLAAGGPMNETIRGTGGVVVVVVVGAVVDVVLLDVDVVLLDDDVELDVDDVDDDELVVLVLVVDSSLWVASAIPTPASTPTATTIPPMIHIRRRRLSSSSPGPPVVGGPAPPPPPAPASVVGIAWVVSTGTRETACVPSAADGVDDGCGLPGTARVGSSGLVMSANYATAIAWKARSSRSTSGPPAA